MLGNPLSVGVLKWRFWEGTHLHVYEYGTYVVLIWIMLIPWQMEIQVRVLTCSDMNSIISVLCFVSRRKSLHLETESEVLFFVKYISVSAATKHESFVKRLCLYLKSNFRCIREHSTHIQWNDVTATLSNMLCKD